MTNLKSVSVIIPCRNEEKFIAKCLDSILEQDYLKENLEILLVDGMSQDKTRGIINDYLQKYPFIKLLDNPKKFTPFALNIGIKNAKGEIIIRMDAHSLYNKDYLSRCIKYLKEYGVDNVGGIWKIMPSEETLINKAIVFVSSSFFGAGDAHYRTGYSKGVKFVDTVFGGCYKKDVFKKIGLYNENLIRSQDMEFNLRLKKSGGKILLVPDIITYYYPKSTLEEFFKHNIDDGIWAVYPIKFGVPIFAIRHFIPLAFILILVGTAILGIFLKIFWWLLILEFIVYLGISKIISIKIALKEKNLRLIVPLVAAFFARHFGYGIGSLIGLIKLMLPAKK